MEESQEEPEFVPLEMSVEELEEEEEDECRVCRGPVEEGRPLFAPCKCSGSMGVTHQDCLTSWLEVTRGDGRCEICKTKFRFDPQYAENTPERLPCYEVFLGLSSRFVAKWLPLAVRICIAASLWLVVAPLLTNFLYHGWMIRPSSILTRWKRELILSDIVSGVVIAAIIIISFLSLMSFADFLRVHWQQAPRDRLREGGEQQRANDGGAERTNGSNEFDSVDEHDDTVDTRIFEFLKSHQQLQSSVTVDERKCNNSHGQSVDALGQLNFQQATEAQWLSEQTKVTQAGASRHNTSAEQNQTPKRMRDALADEGDAVDHEENPQEESQFGSQIEDGEESDLDDFLDEFEDGRRDEGGVLLQMDGGDDDEHVEDDEQDDREIPEVPPLEAAGRNNNEARGFAEIDPILQDDQVDMEINVALDELLGLRGPIGALVRNLLWLLAFNATYLGIFGFVPKTVGSVAYSGFFNTTFCSRIMKAVPFILSGNENQTTVTSILTRIELESIERNTTFKLSEFTTVTLGYLSIAGMIVVLRYALIIFQKVGQKFGHNSFRRSANQELRRLQRGNAGQDANDAQDQDVVDGDEIGTSLAVALDTTVAIVKVGVLLFLKMFLLPLFLGSCLDVSTLHLFGHDVDRRLAFAGGDLFSFILLHWVAGITFMLLVTVFLLQLREVAHPDVLARVIRPQEPQPDLLGNLLHETVVTHMKRMLLSLIIYAPLLSLHIFLPAKLFLASGWEKDFPFFHLNLYHILMPQLQIPLELITFHLSMLALLERYKNSIGCLQHRWMKLMCRKLGLTEYLLPKTISGFEPVGTKQVFAPRENKHSFLKIDSFLIELANANKITNDEFILTNIDKPNASCTPSYEMLPGETLANGERVLSVHTTHIALPVALKEGTLDNNVSKRRKLLLPTKIGRYRLRLNEGCPGSDGPTIEFFREVQGSEISRPPEGWDDLGAGGAWAQGRWAWSTERKSVIEGGVAHRTPFRASSNHRIPIGLTLRVVALVILSWFAITVTAVVLLSAPLAVGRSFFFILRVPKKYFHDPLAFCIGAGLFFPTMSIVTRHMGKSEAGIWKLTRQWLSRFQRPPAQKLLVAMESFSLWFLVAPIMFGLSYEITVVRSQQWFAGEEKLFDYHSLVFPWLVGTVVLNTWSFLLYFNCFTKQFWTNIGNGILEPPLDENGNVNPLARNRDINIANREDINGNGLQLAWQGNRGRAANFYRIWQSVLVNWEWDAVDPTKLVDDFARPVTKQLASALIGSSLSFQLLLYLLIAAFPAGQGGITVPFLGPVDHGVCRVASFRFCMLLHVLFQVASGFSGHIDGWFEAAHEAARDDRYLVGEVLMNYESEAST